MLRDEQSKVTMMDTENDPASLLDLIGNHNDENSMARKDVSIRSLQSSSTLVKVTNGEIARAIASDKTLERRSKSLLDRLRNFTSTSSQKKKLQQRDFCDLTDDEDVSSNGSLSPFTSVSSESSDAFNSWIDEDDEEIASSFHHNNDIVFQYPDNEFVVSQNRSPFELLPSRARSQANENLDAAKICFEKKETNCLATALAASTSKAQSLVLNKELFPESHGMEKKMKLPNEAEAMWKAQVSAFKSMKRLLATTTDFSRALPDLIKLRVFSEEQLQRYDRFRNSSSMSILRAVDERVESDKNAMALFLVALRLHNSDIVDKMHAKIHAAMTSLKNDVSTEITEQRKVMDVIETPQRRNERKSYGNQPSRYSRRPITVNYDHLVTGSQSTYGAYFSKTSSVDTTSDSYQDNLQSRDVKSCRETSQSAYDVMSGKKRRDRDNQNVSVGSLGEKDPLLRSKSSSKKDLLLETDLSTRQSLLLGEKLPTQKPPPLTDVSSLAEVKSLDDAPRKDCVPQDGSKKMIYSGDLGFTSGRDATSRDYKYATGPSLPSHLFDCDLMTLSEILQEAKEVLKDMATATKAIAALEAKNRFPHVDQALPVCSTHCRQAITSPCGTGSYSTSSMSPSESQLPEFISLLPATTTTPLETTPLKFSVSPLESNTSLLAPTNILVEPITTYNKQPITSTKSKSNPESASTSFEPITSSDFTITPLESTTPFESTTTSLESAISTFQSKTTLEFTTIPLESTTTPLEFTKTPLKFTTTPLKSTTTPLESTTALESTITSLESTITSLEPNKTSLESTTTPLEFTTTPLESNTIPFLSSATFFESTTLPLKFVTSLPQSSTPLLESFTPFSESSTPHSKSSTPLPKSSTPLDESSTPIFESSIPLPESSTPLDESSIPLPESSIPFSKSSTPLPQSSTPLDESSTPLDESSVPRPESSTPFHKSSTPLDESSTLPESSTPLSKSSIPLPESSTPLNESSTLPESSSPLSKSSTPLPESSTPLDESSTPLPESSIPLSKSSKLFPESSVSPLQSITSSCSPLAISNNSSPVSSIRRSSSLRVTSTRCTSTPPYHSTSSSGLSDVTSQSEMFKRCSSFSIPSKQASAPRHRNLLLELLKERFTTTLAKVSNVTIKEADQYDVDSCVNELVAHCVVSTRSAWLVRKCPKSSERLDRFLELLVALGFNDVIDIKNSCPMTRQFVGEMIRSAHSRHQSKVDRDDSKMMLAARERSEGATSKSNFRNSNNLESNVVSTSLQHDVKHQSTHASDDKVCDVTITPLIVSRCERSNKKTAMGSFGAFLELGPDNCKYLQKENLVPESGEESGEKAERLLFDLDIQETKNRVKEKERKENDIFLEETRETDKLLSKTDASETLFKQRAEKRRVVDNQAKLCSAIPLSDSLKRQKASTGSKLSSRKYSRLHLYIRKPAAKAKVHQRPGSNARGVPSYVSQAQFPFSIKNKSDNRNLQSVNRNHQQESCKNVEKISASKSQSFLAKGKFDEISERKTSSDRRGKSARKLTIAMPPVHSNHQSKTIGAGFDKEIVKGDSLSTDVFVNEQTIKNSNDLNNNRSCKKLGQTLINQGSTSPPSSAKKKPPHRVSFSELPPVEITLSGQDSVVLPMSNDEPEQAVDVARIQAKPKPLVRTSPGEHKIAPSSPAPATDSLEASLFEMNDTKVHNDETKQQDSAQSPSPANTIDQINELLMDILEEIEAENISLNKCLNDLVREGFLTMDLVRSVSPSFEERTHPCSDNDELLEKRLEESERERCTEKLLDVLANLGLETLQKCRNTILGRLCQLSTYKDYENGQKAAAAACASPTSHNQLCKVRHDNVARSDDVTHNVVLTKNFSSEESEYSTTESEEDIHLLRHQQQRHPHDVIETIKELKPSVATKPKHHKTIAMKRSRVNIRSLLTILIDEEVLEPKQVWRILGAGSETSQKLELKRNLHLHRDRLEELYRVPGLEALQTVMETSTNEEISANQRSRFPEGHTQNDDVRLNLNLNKSSSVQTSELHGGNNCPLTNAARLIKEHTSSLRQQEQRLFSLSAMTSSGSDISPLKSSPPSSLATIGSNDVTVEEMSVEDWCCHNNLASQSAAALRRIGLTRPTQLNSLSEEDIEDLTGLSWLHKARLWVAIENMRLNEFYRRSRSELNDIKKLLDTKQQD